MTCTKEHPPAAHRGAQKTIGECVATSLRDAAVGYATRGWPVFPCRPAAKQPLTRHGFKDATTDIATITRWWQQWPDANIGVATGAPGPDVLDVDVKDGRAGLELFDRARRAGLLAGATAIIRTPSGGLHLWFRGTTQSSGAVGPDRALELKARGGYVLVPPSRTPAGVYRVEDQRTGPGGVINWRAVVQLLAPPRPASAFRRSAFRRSAGNTAALARWVAAQQPGNRNKALFWAACRALEAGCEDLEAIAAAAHATGLPEMEIRRTLASAQRHVKGTT